VPCFGREETVTWIRVSDDFFDCPKVQALLSLPGGRAALVLHFSALTYCGRHLTNGELTTVAISMAARDGRIPRVAGKLLVQVGLWDERDGHVAIHDYLDYNPSREEVLAKRAQKQTAGRAGGQASAQARAAAAATTSGSHPGEAKSNPRTPSPSPTPSPTPEDSSQDLQLPVRSL